MLGLIGVLTLITVLMLSLIVTRIATTALVLTGLSYEAAKFQARSAFTGTGFTTQESEKIVNHPVRRRVITALMVARSAGFISIIMSLILSFGTSGNSDERLYRLIYLIIGVVVLWLISKSKYIERQLNRLISRALNKWTDLDTRDYVGLLNLKNGYTVQEVKVRKGDWVVDKSLAECNLNAEGVTVLGINRIDGGYVGAPTGETEIYADDTLILYGRVDTLQDIDKRLAGVIGDDSHDVAVNKQRQRQAEQKREDAERKKKKEKENNEHVAVD